jgi:hypothetical protein
MIPQSGRYKNEKIESNLSLPLSIDRQWHTLRSISAIHDKKPKKPDFFGEVGFLTPQNVRSIIATIPVAVV